MATMARRRVAAIGTVLLVATGRAVATQFAIPDNVLRAAAPIVTDSPNFSNFEDQEACIRANDAVASCSDLAPGFEGTQDEQVASCLCCDGSRFAPRRFNNLAAGCAAYVSTAFPESTSAYSGTAICRGYPPPICSILIGVQYGRP
jgi:hypothetical protein